jgi:hypothetical protein
LKGELERKGKNETEQNQRNELNTRELIPWRWKITISVVSKKMLV